MSTAASLPPRPVVRSRLIERLAEGPVGIVESGAGYGKSVLASQYRQALGMATAYVPLGPADDDPAVLTASLRRALVGARLSDLVAATDAAAAAEWADQLLDALAAHEGILLVLDDAHHLQSAGVAALLLRLVRGMPAQHRLLITARSLVRALELLWHLPGTIRLDTGALAFTAEEARELLARRGVETSAADARAAVESTHGWATALVLIAAVRSLEADGLGLGSASDDDPVATSLRGILEATPAGDRATLIQLAHLPFVSPELCDAVAGRPGAFVSIVASGVPLARTDSGWWELPAPVAAHLVRHAPVSAGTVRVASEAYSRGGATVAALRVLADTGLADDAAARLAEMGPDRVEDVGLGTVRDLIESLPTPALSAHPGALLHLARLSEIAHDSELRAATLARAQALVHPTASPALAREIDAERARDLMWDERTRHQSRQLAVAVTDNAGEGELIARARALDTLGRLGSWFSADGPQPEAEALLLESARMARRVRQPTWTAQALVALGAGFYFALCRFERALEALDEAMAELPVRNRYRAMVQIFRSDTLAHLGRWEEAEAAVANVREIGRAVGGEHWILAFAAWSEADLASCQGDAARTVRAYREIDAHRDTWFEQPAGGECLAQVADSLSRVAEHELALECLGRARERMEGNERIVRVHGAGVLARSGDAEAAEQAIVAALEGPAAEPLQRWPLHLQHAYVALRRGDPQAARLAAHAFEYCREIGYPEGPLIREPVLTRELLGLAVATGSPAAVALERRQTQDTWSVRLLGGFELLRGSVAVTLPAGFPSRVVRILAVVGGRMHADVLVELMWPDAGPVQGRNRLRNLLSRVRAAAGELVLRDNDSVVLASGCQVDAVRFEADSATALAAQAAGEPRRAVMLARAALERYRGELLPDDRYEEWTEAPRERLRLRQLELLGLLAAAAERDGEFDEAIRLLERAVDVEPRDERRYIELARLMALQGRTGSAFSVLRQARGALRSAGLAASDELERVEAELRFNA